MDLRVENFSSEDPRTTWIFVWAEKRKFPFHKDLMSDFCYMAFDGEKPIASVFLYTIISSGFAMIGFGMSDPETTKEQREVALEAVVAEAEKAAKLLNRKYIISYAGSKGAVAMFSRLNYETADLDVTQFIKKI